MGAPRPQHSPPQTLKIGSAQGLYREEANKRELYSLIRRCLVLLWIRTVELAGTKIARSDSRSGCALRWRDGSTGQHRHYAPLVQDEIGPKGLESKSSTYPRLFESKRGAKPSFS